MMSDPQSILLHVCCAPCATSSIERLLEAGRAPVLWFSNANIDRAEEFERRLDAVRQLAAHHRLPLLVDAYDHRDWLAVAAACAEAPEGGERCRRCFGRVLGRAAAAMAGAGCAGFTTTLTVSPHKNSRDIFDIGGRFAGFEAIDFKKRDGFKRSLELTRRFGFYRQAYCGCEFAKKPLRQLAPEAKPGYIK